MGFEEEQRKANKLRWDAIDKRQEQIAGFMKEGNMDKVLETLAPNAKFITPDGTVADTKEKVAETMKKYPVKSFPKCKLDEVVGDKDLVYARGTYKMFSADNKEIDSGKYFTIWKRIGNDYFIYNDISHSKASLAA